MEQFYVEKILEHRPRAAKNPSQAKFYKIRWGKIGAGVLGPEVDSWEPAKEKHIEVPDDIQKYWKKLQNESVSPPAKKLKTGSYVFKSRDTAVDSESKLKFTHVDYPEEKFEIMHPNVITANAEIIIMPVNPNPDNGKYVGIPVHKDIMTCIPYFAAQFKDNAKWRETEKLENGPLKTSVPEIKGLQAKDVFSYVESVYYKEKNPLNKENCVPIFRLAQFWCDDFMLEESRRFITENIDEHIFSEITDDASLIACFSEVIKNVGQFAFGLGFQSSEVVKVD